MNLTRICAYALVSLLACSSFAVVTETQPYVYSGGVTVAGGQFVVSNADATVYGNITGKSNVTAEGFVQDNTNLYNLITTKAWEPYSNVCVTGAVTISITNGLVQKVCATNNLTITVANWSASEAYSDSTYRVLIVATNFAVVVTNLGPDPIVLATPYAETNSPWGTWNLITHDYGRTNPVVYSINHQ
jgi:hypothetical protein